MTRLFPKPTGPYEESAEAYRDRDMSPLAMPHKEKSPPIAGYGGKVNRGQYVVTDADLRDQAEYYNQGNVGIKMPEGYLGIDVDVRNGGDTSLAFKSADLGPLPPTLSTTSRDDGSKIQIYKVPAGEEWRDKLCPGVDIIWWGSGHCYAMAWPSIHPETGQVYHWYDADDVALDGIPEDGWASAVPLPEAYIADLLKPEVERVAPEDRPVLMPDLARRRVEGVMRRLAKAPKGERNIEIFKAGCMLGGYVARLPEDCTDEDLTEGALKDRAREVFGDIGVAADEPKANDTLRRGFEAGYRDPAGDEEWDGGIGKADADFDAVPGKSLVHIDASNTEVAYKRCCDVVGTRSLSGIFSRAGSLVHTPLIDEDGYVPPTGKRVYDDGTVRYDDDGPAQVRRLDPARLRAYVAHNANVTVSRVPRGQRSAVIRPALLPPDVAGLLVASPERVRGARRLHTVTHTPLVLADGSMISDPGYHVATGTLYLPSLIVPVPEGVVTRALVAEAVALLDLMLGEPDNPDDGFPFVTPHDRATYVAALLTPLLKQIVQPPYPLIALGAPTPGSGKSLLAKILRIIHGGVFRAEMPRSEEELRKQLTTILDQTTPPVVTFDNLTGVLRSARLDGLLTEAEYADRLLGGNEEATLVNDRLWTITGNNLRLGGDLRRRTYWVTIDAGVAHPEERTNFKIEPKVWVPAHRGEILGALLTLVVGWCQAGQPVPQPTRSDDYKRWQQVTQGILTWAGIDGTVGGNVQIGGLEDTEDAEIIDALAERFGVGKPWTAGDVILMAEMDDAGLQAMLPAPSHGNGRPNEKSLGWWLKTWRDRPTESGLVLRKGENRKWVIGLAKDAKRELSDEDRDLL